MVGIGLGVGVGKLGIFGLARLDFYILEGGLIFCVNLNN